jgi:hypothetical protein
MAFAIALFHHFGNYHTMRIMVGEGRDVGVAVGIAAPRCRQYGVRAATMSMHW